MTDSNNNIEPLCFTDFALQEYIMGRLADDVRNEIRKHLEGCDECSAYTELLKQETDLLRTILVADEDSHPQGSDSDETLALYLDGALGPESAQALEKVLAGSSEKLSRLVNLFRRISEVKEDLSGPATTLIPNALPEGLVLQMPKRKSAPRRVSDLDSGEAEESA